MSLWRAHYTIWHRRPHNESHGITVNMGGWHGYAVISIVHISVHQISTLAHAHPKDNRSLALSCIKQMSKYKLYIIKTVVIKPVLNKGLPCTWMSLFGEASSIYCWWLLTVGLPLNAAVSYNGKDLWPLVDRCLHVGVDLIFQTIMVW
jgi:hypothetical protein